jgi:hypothetical protein
MNGLEKWSLITFPFSPPALVLKRPHTILVWATAVGPKMYEGGTCSPMAANFILKHDLIYMLYCSVKFCIYTLYGGGYVVHGWGTMLHAGRSRFQFPFVSGCVNWPNASSCTMPLASTQFLTEKNTRNLPGGKGQSAHMADPIAVCWLCRKCGTPYVSQPYGSPRPITGIAFPFYTNLFLPPSDTHIHGWQHCSHQSKHVRCEQQCGANSE